MPIDTKEEHSLGSKGVNTSKPKKWFTGCKPFILHIISRLLSYGKTMQGENIWTLKMLSLKRNKRYQWTLKYLQSYINHLQPLFFREKKDKKLGMHQSNQIKFLKKKKKKTHLVLVDINQNDICQLWLYFIGFVLYTNLYMKILLGINQISEIVLTKMM